MNRFDSEDFYHKITPIKSGEVTGVSNKGTDHVLLDKYESMLYYAEIIDEYLKELVKIKTKCNGNIDFCNEMILKGLSNFENKIYSALEVSNRNRYHTSSYGKITYERIVKEIEMYMEGYFVRKNKKEVEVPGFKTRIENLNDQLYGKANEYLNPKTSKEVLVKKVEKIMNTINEYNEKFAEADSTID